MSDEVHFTVNNDGTLTLAADTNELVSLDTAKMGLVIQNALPVLHLPRLTGKQAKL
jgi:hypothetical protein